MGDNRNAGGLAFFICPVNSCNFIPHIRDVHRRQWHCQNSLTVEGHFIGHQEEDSDQSDAFLRFPMNLLPRSVYINRVWPSMAHAAALFALRPGEEVP